MKKFDKNYLIILLISILLMLPLVNDLYFHGHDTGFHIANIIGISEVFDFKNILSLKIFPIIARNFGYGTGLFYPELAHLAAAIFYKYLNINVFSSIKILNFFITLLSGFSMYKFMKTVTKNNNLSLLSTLFYLTFPYKMFDIYVRDALSESLVFIFLPLVFLSLYYILNKEYKKFYLYFVLSYVGLISSHLVMTIYVTIFLVIVLLCNFKKVWNKEIIKRFIYATIIVLLIKSPFIVGLLIHKFKGNYVVFTDGAMANRFGVYFNSLKIYQYFIGHHGEMGYHFINIVALILVIYYFRKIKKEHIKIKDDYGLYLGVISTIFGLLTTSYLFPWIIMPKTLLMIQFPWRLGMFTAFGISILIFYSINSLKKNKRKIIILGVLSCILTASFCIFNQEYSKIKADDYDLSRLGMGCQYEYLPVKANKNRKYIDKRGNDIIALSPCTINTLNDDFNEYKFKVDTTESVKLELPRLFYYGYEIKDENDNKINYHENKKGFIEIEVPSGVYTLKYTGTKLEQIGNIVSIITSISFILVLVFKKNKV